DAIPWASVRPDLVGTQLPLLPNGKLQVKQDGADCRFLDANRRCSIHAALGRAIFPPCARFPFAFVETPDGVAVSASTLCGSVRDRLGPPLLDRPDDLYQRMAIAREAVVRQSHFRLWGDHEVPWEEYRAAEAALLAHLGRNDLPVHRRLWLGSALLANWPKGFRAVPPELEGLAIPVAPADQREAVRILLFDFLRFFGLPTAAEVGRDLRPGQDARLAAMLRNNLFSKLLAMAFDLTTAHNLGILFYLLVLHLEEAASGPISEAQWETLGRLFFHGGIHAAFKSEEAAGYRTMFGDANFGLWLLSYPLEAPCADS
ncbi:MAG: YkgJ family cysteine cluster protein, partial [Candidatus Sericytochromatia bacterium]